MTSTYILTCPVCGKPFTCHNRKQICCSKLCRSQQLKKRILVICKRCGKEIETIPSLRDRKRYCSWACKQKAMGDANRVPRVPIICVICGKVFDVPVRNKELSKYCSDTCARAKSSKQLVHCAYCGKDIWKFPSRMGDKGHHYCSRSCKHKAQAKSEIHITLTCEHCGKSYETTTHQVRCRGSRYCSRICMDAGSRTRETSEAFYWRKIAAEVRERDGQHCRLCGKISKYQLDVHHIIPARLFGTDYEAANRQDNLIALCRPCHRKVESDPILIRDRCIDLPR